MVHITDITDHLLVQCPYCNMGQLITKWGNNKCLFEGCRGEIDLEYNLQNIEKLLEIAAQKLKVDRIPRKIYKPACQLFTFPNGDTVSRIYLTDDPKNWMPSPTPRFVPPKPTSEELKVIRKTNPDFDYAKVKAAYENS